MLVPSTHAAGDYDLLVCVLGYEPRSNRVARQYSGVAKQMFAYDFATPDLFAYAENEALLESLKVQSFHESADDFADRIRAHLEVSGADGRVSLCVDISSMSRSLLAALLLALHEASLSVDLAIDFMYSPPRYDPTVVPAANVERAEIAHPRLAGLESDPSDPVVGIVGLGFEPNLALGVSEYLDLTGVFAFMPFGHDEAYDAATAQANASLFLGDTPCLRSDYDLRNPYNLYARLESLVYGLSGGQRIAIVPLGPKVFSLCAILVALNSPSPVAVWRFSLGASTAAPTESVGELVCLSMRSKAR